MKDTVEELMHRMLGGSTWLDGEPEPVDIEDPWAAAAGSGASSSASVSASSKAKGKGKQRKPATEDAVRARDQRKLQYLLQALCLVDVKEPSPAPSPVAVLVTEEKGEMPGEDCQAPEQAPRKTVRFFDELNIE
jgi:hypothetical protein